MNIIKLYILARRLHLKKVPLLPRFIKYFMRLLFSCDIPYTANIHQTVKFPHHGLGVVIGHDTIVGENTKILQNVTIGGRNGVRANPIIGKNVIIGAGACIIGNVTIGDNAKIGANAVVVNDVPKGCTAVGVPARIIKTD